MGKKIEYAVGGVLFIIVLAVYYLVFKYFGVIACAITIIVVSFVWQTLTAKYYKKKGENK